MSVDFLAPRPRFRASSALNRPLINRVQKLSLSDRLSRDDSSARTAQFPSWVVYLFLPQWTVFPTCISGQMLDRLVQDTTGLLVTVVHRAVQEKVWKSHLQQKSWIRSWTLSWVIRPWTLVLRRVLQRLGSASQGKMLRWHNHPDAPCSICKFAKSDTNPCLHCIESNSFAMLSRSLSAKVSHLTSSNFISVVSEWHYAFW